MDALPKAEALAIADWLELELSQQTKRPYCCSLASALMSNISNLEGRIEAATKCAATEAAAKRAEAALASMSLRTATPKKAVGTPKGPGTPKAPGTPRTGKGKKRPSNEGPSAEGEDESRPGLERMKGGNPAGPPCKAFQAGRCRGKCRFSHVDGGAGNDDDAGDDDAE